MKQELPFAVALLAAGCLLWFSQSPESAKSQPLASVDSAESINGQPSTAGNATVDSEFNSSKVVQATFLDDDSNQDQGSANSEKAQEILTGFRDPTAFIHEKSNAQSLEVLANTAIRIADSQPLSSSIQVTGNMFDEVVSATGTYYQMGQGTSKSRMELNFGMLPNSPRVFQLCDGRFVYKIQSEGDQRTFEFVDLMKIRESSGETGVGISPTGWVATGGIASLFQHLASAFNFGPIEIMSDSQIVLRGSWDEEALRQILKSDKSNQAVLDSPMNSEDWTAVPPQIPHAVELVLRKDSQLGYFPKRVSFMKFSTDSGKRAGAPENLQSGLGQVRPTVTLEFSPRQQLANRDGSPISDQFFVIDSSNLESVDLTRQYIARIESLQAVRQTKAVESETTNR
jgi:hypothetical protein